MLFYKLILLIFFCLTAFAAIAQNDHDVDSLEQVLADVKDADH